MSAPTLRVVCTGSSYEIGHEHGRAAAKYVHGSLEFYRAFFLETARLDWVAVTAEAERWLPYLETNWAEYVAEMRGLAAGAGLQLADILALNVRTEIAYGLAAPTGSSDGCTAFAYYPSGQRPYLAQNWDWEARQAPNLIRLSIHQAPPKAGVIDMITEAGIIGKIGLNSKGIGVCLNAVRAPGVNHEKLPVHLALRAVLDGDYSRVGDDGGLNGVATNGNGEAQVNGHDSTNANGVNNLAQTAAAMLERVGVASAAHILIANAERAVGLETSCKDTERIAPITTDRGVLVAHSNHYICPHGVSDKERQWKDSVPRLARIEKLVRHAETEGKSVDYSVVNGWLLDEEGYPVSICRDRWEESDAMTLFNIVMDLREKSARVRMGRLEKGAERLMLEAGSE